MKKGILITAIVLIIIAIGSFGLSKWFYYQGGLVMDGSGDFYAGISRKVHLCENLAKGFGITGAVLFVISLIIKKKDNKTTEE